MPSKQNPEPDDPEQSRRFVETARELAVDETASSFERALKGVKLPTDRRHEHDDQNEPKT